MQLLGKGALACLCFLAWSACGNKAAEKAVNTENTTNTIATNLPTQAEEVAVEFCKAISTLEMQKAKALSTKATHEVIDFIAAMTLSLSAEEKKQAAEESVFLTSAQCIKEENTAVCEVCCNAEKESQSLELVKEGEQWLVKMTKEDGNMDGIEIIEE